MGGQELWEDKSYKKYKGLLRYIYYNQEYMRRDVFIFILLMNYFWVMNKGEVICDQCVHLM